MKLIDKVVLDDDGNYYEIYEFESKKEKEDFMKKRKKYKEIREKLKKRRRIFNWGRRNRI